MVRDRRPYHSAAVCAACFGESALADFVTANATDERCDFCGRESDAKVIAAPVAVVAEHMEACIRREYESPAEGVGWDSGEGGWIGVTPMTTDDLFDDLGVDLPNDDDRRTLLYTLCDGLGGADQEWVRINPYGPAPEEVYQWSWERFCMVVKHRRRYFLPRRDPDEPELLSAHELLARIAQFCRDHGFVRTVRTGARLYRVVKGCPGEDLSKPSRLGPPPPQLAKFPSRMSPAGIPMFYGADDPDTSLRETIDGAGRYAVACFEMTRDVVLLDLTTAPGIPSLFDPNYDPERPNLRYELMFLARFVREVSRPIDRKDRAHVDYVPTQIVAEYMRDLLVDGGRRIDGIRYTSAQRPPHACYALFAGQHDVVPARTDAWLRLVDVREHVADSPASQSEEH